MGHKLKIVNEIEWEIWKREKNREKVDGAGDRLLYDIILIQDTFETSNINYSSRRWCARCAVTFFCRSLIANFKRFKCMRSPCSNIGPVGSWFSITSNSFDVRVWSSSAVAKSWHCLRNSWYSFCENPYCRVLLFMHTKLIKIFGAGIFRATSTTMHYRHSHSL